MSLSVGLNALHLVPNETGGSELYARRLVGALAAAEEAPRLVLFAPREAAASLEAEHWAEAVEIVRVPVQARSRVRRVLAEQTLLPPAVRRARVDLLHNLFSTAPALPGVPQVTTILDVIYKRFPEAHAGLLTHGMRLLVSLAARRSRRVLTLSDAAKHDVVRFLGVSPDNIDVTLLGPALGTVASPVPEPELRERLRLGARPILLTVSAKRPHKNIPRLIEASARLTGPGAPVLVLPGYPTVFEKELRGRGDAILGPERVRFTGWVDDSTLEGLYQAATAFAFPSLAEGFGLPVLDAMVRGVPVACSDASSLPEVAGDAAVYFDPLDIDSIAAALQRVLGDEQLRKQLAERGRERGQRFSWAATAAATLASYHRAVAVT
jgi:glycosyltransferase involved in cell wall biosynthesis